MQKEERITGRKWQQTRRRILRQNPLCVHCRDKGKINLAEEVDHIVALVNGGSNDDSNLMGLCRACHYEKTLLDLGRKIKRRVDVNGIPDGW